MKKTIKVDEKPMVPNSLGFLKNQKKIVFPKIMVTPKWMVKIMENPIKIDDLGGTPIFGNTQMEKNSKVFECDKTGRLKPLILPSLVQNSMMESLEGLILFADLKHHGRRHFLQSTPEKPWERNEFAAKKIEQFSI